MSFSNLVVGEKGSFLFVIPVEKLFTIKQTSHTKKMIVTRK